jgi:hypothetical protein
MKHCVLDFGLENLVPEAVLQKSESTTTGGELFSLRGAFGWAEVFLVEGLSGQEMPEKILRAARSSAGVMGRGVLHRGTVWTKAQRHEAW